MTNYERERYSVLINKDERVKHFLENNDNLTELFGFVTEHNQKSIDIFKFLETLDFVMGDYFGFKSGGDGDNGEILMSYLDAYFEEVTK